MYSLSELPADVVKKLPEPKGYRVLLAMPVVEEKTAGGIFMPEKLRDEEQTASILGRVMKLGPEAYKDPDKFPTGPWCAVGDWVVFRSYSGTRFSVDGHELRLINDDTIEAVVANPKGYGRA